MSLFEINFPGFTYLTPRARENRDNEGKSMASFSLIFVSVCVFIGSLMTRKALASTKVQEAKNY